MKRAALIYRAFLLTNQISHSYVLKTTTELLLVCAHALVSKKIHDLLKRELILVGI